MMYVRAIALLILCAAAIQATAGTAGTGRITVYGAGTGSCGKWLASSTDVEDRLLKVNWVLGWVSAAGHYEVHGDLKETDSDAITAWVDNYCRGSPLKDISDAAAALVRALAKNSKT
jgi:hypothetical protein